MLTYKSIANAHNPTIPTTLSFSSQTTSAPTEEWYQHAQTLWPSIIVKPSLQLLDGFIQRIIPDLAEWFLREAAV